MAKIQIEIDEKYSEALDILKQVIPDDNGEQITDNGKMVEVLIDSFMAFLQEQAEQEQSHSDGYCGTGGCGCSH